MYQSGNLHVLCSLQSVNLDIGIYIEGEQIGIPLYTDDIVLIAENENDLQLLIYILNTWCKHKALNIIFEKTKIVALMFVTKLFLNILNNTGDKTQLCFKPEFTLNHSVIFPFSCRFQESI
jgi:hypothetical protein